MRILVLGPIRVESGGSRRAVHPAMVRRLLAVLASRRGRPVRVDDLAEMLWPADPPRNPVKAVQLYAHRLRGILRTDDRVVHHDSGYALVSRTGDLDADEFAELIRAAASAEQAEDRVRLLDAALGLWRGTPYEDVDCAALEPEVERLTELRLRAFEDRASARLELGDAGQVAVELAPLVEEFPFRERFATLSMISLARTDRRDEALEVFRTIRDRLVEELGIDPGPELSRVHQDILRGEIPTGSGAATPSPCPAQLPADVATFTGRSDELEQLLSTAVNTSAGMVVVTAVDGMAGVGKTALAVRAAHQVAHRFGDGQVFVDLRGFSRGLEPVGPVAAQEQVLRSLGVPGQQIPHEPAERTAFYRARLADRNLLILLDNAVDEEQVRPLLLPGGAACLVLVTSRNRLTGLDSATSVSLDVLPEPDARDLFCRIAGTDHPVAVVEEIVRLCGRLPLAIRIAAARLRARAAWTAADLADRLRDREHRLERLATGDRSVTVAIDLSYRHLAETTRRMYRLLGLHPGTDFDVNAAVALAGCDRQETEKALENLVEAHLLGRSAYGRFAFHDLVRDHAAALASHDDSEEARREASKRLLDHYACVASNAMDVAYPYEADQRPRPTASPTTAQVFDDSAQATGWLETEMPNLLATALADCAPPSYPIHLSATVHRHLSSRGRYRDAETLHEHALRQARSHGLRSAEATVRTGLGHIRHIQGRYDWAQEHFEAALEARHDGVDEATTVQALLGLGGVHRMLSRMTAAADCFADALELAESAADARGQLTALVSLGQLHGVLGDHDRQFESHGKALALARRIGHRVNETNALCGLAHASSMLGRDAAAGDYWRQALDVSRAVGFRHGELYAWWGLGDIDVRLERFESAVENFRQTLRIATEIGDRNGEFEAHHALGRALAATGDPEQAIVRHEAALRLAQELEQVSDQARAHDGLGNAYRKLGHLDRAREHWRKARDLLESVQLMETEEIGIKDLDAKLAPDC